MQPMEVTVASITADTDGIATAQDQTTVRALVANITASFANNAVLAPNGSLATGGIVVLPKASKLTITSASDFSATQFTILGDDANGQPIREVIAGPNNATVTGAVPFKVIRSISPSAASGNDFTVGIYPLEAQLLAFPTTLASPRPVTITSAANLSALAFTVEGTDRSGRPISQTITGPNAATVTTTMYFKTVTAVRYNGAMASNVEVGWGVTSVCAPQPVDHYRNPFGIGLGCSILSGTPTYSVEHTFDDIQSATFNEGTAEWFPHSSIDGATTDQDGNYAYPPSAIRLVIDSGSGTVRMRSLQAGI